LSRPFTEKAKNPVKLTGRPLTPLSRAARKLPHKTVVAEGAAGGQAEENGPSSWS
jgi:hypothetical protein